MTTPSTGVGAGGLLVAEIFGPTFQGEGPSAGQQAAFLRLSRCNLTCAWCDTPYTWDGRRFDPAEQTLRLGAEKTLARLLAIPAPLVVVTGGEPLLQQERLLPVVAGCRAAGRQVEVETNGTVMPNPALLGVVTRFNVSPKLANSQVAPERRIRPDVLGALAASGKAVFKFVVEGPGDLDEVAALVAGHGLGRETVWVMPQGETTGQVLAVMRAVPTASWRAAGTSPAGCTCCCGRPPVAADAEFATRATGVRAAYGRACGPERGRRSNRRGPRVLGSGPQKAPA